MVLMVESRMKRIFSRIVRPTEKGARRHFVREMGTRVLGSSESMLPGQHSNADPWAGQQREGTHGHTPVNRLVRTGPSVVSLGATPG